MTGGVSVGELNGTVCKPVQVGYVVISPNSEPEQGRGAVAVAGGVDRVGAEGVAAGADEVGTR